MRGPVSESAKAPSALQRELVRYATLAPSSHNTQCWSFQLGAGGITILPDTLRRCPAVDPDDHHLYVSLGCAAENLVEAALAVGLHSDVAVDAARGNIHISLAATRAVRSPLFEAIPLRQCTRAEYDGRTVSAADLKLLEQTGTGLGVRPLLFTGRPQMEQILEHVTRANSAQIGDAAFMAELKSWIRFNARDALVTRDGLFSAASGSPTLPHWLGSLLLPVFMTARSENDRYAQHVRSSSGLAVFVSDANDKAHWVEAGRCYERFALQATALGMRNALLNQPVEVAALRPQFAAYLGLTTGRPDLVVRFGYGPATPRSLRRPVDAVLQ
ncbi:MAG: Tat pathway signal protein [Ferruginibacter sp.]|nr:Tat pathway signal protein [Rhodoferax sp.]